MKKIIPLEEAVGMVLPHDITEIRTTENLDTCDDKPFKGRAFKKGHIISRADLPRLKSLGKDHIYALQLQPEDIHENEAAEQLAAALCGTGAAPSGEPVEGKINILAASDGLLKINTDALYRFNLLGEVMCATLHNNTPVKKGELIAGTRLIPLVGKRALVDQAAEIAGQNNGVISVLPIKKASAGLVITGNEIFHGRIRDSFEPVLRRKLEDLGSEVKIVKFAPDDAEIIAREITTCIASGADLIITSGGMSVDPDDVTRQGIKQAGATNVVYGTPVLPGAMFLVGTIGSIPVMGLPACGMFNKITVFDLILPRILAGEIINRHDIAALGHGGLCRQCETCRYPICGFGK
ncbi:molybdopterin-binding protein [Thermodesulfobacteriota bacterium]